MNAVEIEEAVSQLASEPFDRAEFPFAFLTAFGNKKTTVDRLRSGTSNASDIPGAVLQRNNIHIATCEEGQTGAALTAVRLSPKTKAAKARFIVATDGQTFEAEDLTTDDPPVICEYPKFADHFGFFLPLAGISTVKQIRESAFDIRATGRLNKLYIELRKLNPEWDTPERQHDMNHFMARLIFCFFAEDTDIFNGGRLFTDTVEQMGAPDGSNTHEVIEQIFRAMNTKWDARKAAGFRPWAEAFPYVNGGLFAGSTEVPRFSKIARSILINIGSLDWQKINPDIFGSMIQAVADDEERGALGMHYTSVPNILKVLNPLFLDDLHAKLEEAGDNPRMLLNLRKRMARIRVFDPACGSGNFLVIAYKEMRAIEAVINQRRGESERPTDIPITNFRGIEIRDFPTEIARLALIIAEYQCDVLYRGQKEALKEFLPLDTENWITCGNALRLDWLSICPPTGTGVKLHGDDLFSTPLDQAQIDFENEGGETYICGNPPYKGTKNQSSAEKEDLKALFSKYTAKSGTLDYVCGWFLKAAQYTGQIPSKFAFVATNSICQGSHVPVLWPMIFELGLEIFFAFESFRWKNLASKNAGVTVAIVGVSRLGKHTKRFFENRITGDDYELVTDYISPYLIPRKTPIVQARSTPLSDLGTMALGNAPYDGGHLILNSRKQVISIGLSERQERRWIRPLLGSAEIIDGRTRFCIWIEDKDLEEANNIEPIRTRINEVKAMRLSSKDAGTRAMANRPHQFREMYCAKQSTIAVPLVSSEVREYLTPDIIPGPCCMTNKSYALYDAAIWNFAILVTKLHLCWISAVCGKLETRLSYSNKMGWNTFPIPTLTDQNKADLTRCAEDILLAREAHFPATIADLYDPEDMPDDLRAAHERNDEVLERIYIGRCFRNDTERLEKLFELYTKMIANAPKDKAARKPKRIA